MSLLYQKPPEGLMEFIAQAREDGKAVIYIGFGSIVVPDATAVTKAVVAAVLVRRLRAQQVEKGH